MSPTPLSERFVQLHLPLELQREPTFAEYLSGPNAEAVAALRAAAEGPAEPFIFLFGGASTGKTHLLQAACLAAVARARKAHYVPLDMAELEPNVLDGLEQLDLLAIDDLQRVAGEPAWEVALFNLFNRARERGSVLLISASLAPDRIPVRLPDLASRLLWGPRYCLLPLSDTECMRLVQESAQRRGLRIGPDAARFIMYHHPRDPGSLMSLVARIDTLCLREQRQPSIPLIRRAMQDDDGTPR